MNDHPNTARRAAGLPPAPIEDPSAVTAVARAMAEGGHMALGGNGGAPDFIRALDRHGFVIRRKSVRRRLRSRLCQLFLGWALWLDPPQ